MKKIILTAAAIALVAIAFVAGTHIGFNRAIYSANPYQTEPGTICIDFNGQVHAYTID